MRAVWPGAIVEDATLWVHISAIRRALGPDRSMLMTVSGRGYRLMGNWVTAPHDASASDPKGEGVNRLEPQPLTNIPETVHDLIGRGAAIEKLINLSSAYRAITLTGPGGIGKTVLALEVARRLSRQFSGNAWFIDLSSLSDASLLASAVATTIGLRLGGGAITPQTIGRGDRTSEITSGSRQLRACHRGSVVTCGGYFALLPTCIDTLHEPRDLANWRRVCVSRSALDDTER